MNSYEKRQVKLHWFKLGHRRCPYCCVQLNYAPDQKNSATIDHIIPKSKGGSDKRRNLLVVCHSCNQLRRDMNFKQFVLLNKPPKIDWLLEKYQKAHGAKR